MKITQRCLLGKGRFVFSQTSLVFIASFASLQFFGINSLWANTTWQVAVLFLGANEGQEYHQEVDRNLLELSRVQTGPYLKVSIHRDSPREKGILPLPGQTPDRLIQFFKNAFPQKIHLEKPAYRILIIYGHGLGFNGLKEIKLKALREVLEQALPQRANQQNPIDLLWFDSCFMATVEVAYEFRNLTSWLLASEEAEFTAGAPFESLQFLNEGPSDLRVVGETFAESFLQSYSYLKKGSQRKVVFSSSATISLIRTSELNFLVSELIKVRTILERLQKPQWDSLLRSRNKRVMEKTELSDLGSLLLRVRALKGLDPQAGTTVLEVLKLLELNKKNGRKTNPRIILQPSHPNMNVVFGYNQWTRGHEKDKDILEKLPTHLRPEGFFLGPKNQKWPYRNIHQRLYVTPFTVGLNEFHFFFWNPRTGLEQEETSIARIHDLVTFPSENPKNPVVFSGYTQGIGASAERYTGLAILEPGSGGVNLEYLELDFDQATNWGHL